MKYITKQAFTQRLLEAAYWTAQRLDMNDVINCLRSKELQPLKPIIFGDSHGLRGKAYYEWYLQELQSIMEQVEYVASKRSECMGMQQILPLQQPVSLKGKILLFDPSWSFDDGMSREASENLLNQDECPPWDTFLYYYLEHESTEAAYTHEPSSRYNGVLCWIPKSLVKLVDAGAACASGGSLSWLNPSDSKLPDSLRDIIPFDLFF